MKLILSKLQLLQNAEIHQNQNSQVLKQPKRADFETPHTYKNWFHVKSEWQKNWLISTQCYIDLRNFFSQNQFHVIFFFFSGHDSSVRLWNLETKTCVQEITAHRKKFDESIFDVAFHPSRPYIASAGADALAKVFVWKKRWRHLVSAK